ncbi:hypothetical protein EDC94DRAFT_517117 [Helicostylum pulchrum]|nr:hypothetical protein EDC94DRAFT_517117 [Helicostylum pulchrum]
MSVCIYSHTLFHVADRAYTLLNGVTFRAGIKLQLKINPPFGDNPEPEAHAGILHIKNLPSHTNNKSLYELFRPFGPMMLCKILVEQGSTYKGTALVQYFNSDNTLDAEHNMNNKQVQDNIITVLPFVSSKRRDSTTPTLPPVSSPIRSDASSMVDYTNLYIKNLDLNVKSADLFENFRKFGHIISARVMKNAQTKQSKGFGFVSFSKADEAQKAKADMDGEYILSKPVIVAFHEPKKPRDASPTDTSFNSQRVPLKHHPPPPMPSFNSPNNNLFAEQQQQPQQNGYYQPTSGAFINTPPYVRPTFRRRGSVESVLSIMTETSSQSRRHTVTKAVLALEKSDDKHVQDIVDMILTLKKKDLATCLFNKVFLKAKVRQAKYALDIFQEELQEEQEEQQEEVKPVATKHESIPIVAPQPPASQDPVLLNDKELGEEIDKFLSTLNGLELHEKKQLLGDRLFPLVKSTGVKQAPKITIKLLDSVPLDELAYSMYDKDKLKHQVTRIVSIISARY